MQNSKILCLLITPFLLLSSCDFFSSRKSFVFYPDHIIKRPVIEAIDYPIKKQKSNVDPYEVRVYLANLYYGKNYGSEEIVYHKGYNNLMSIKVYLETNSEVVSLYDVDLDEYSKQENGIIWNDSGKAKIKDFKMVYSFDIQTVFTDSTNQVISFVIKYEEDVTEHGIIVDFVLEKDDVNIKLSGFNDKYF